MKRSEIAAIAVGLGVVVGFAYTLSPLTLIGVSLIVWAARWAGRGQSPRERQWFVTLLAVAVASRFLMIAALYLTADPAKSYATFFGDEELFKSRSVWLRNLNLGVPVSPADVIYVFDETGDSIYISVLGYIQALVGDAPYGVHALNAAFYLVSVLALYRLARPAYGGIVAIAGLSLLLFLPTQFVWSMSALKEPIYTLVVVAEVMCALWVVRGRSWPQRAMAVTGVLAAAVALGAIRRAGAFVVLGGATVGLAMGLAFSRPRSRGVLLGAVLAAAGLLLSTSVVQARLMGAARQAALYHIGHVLTPGHSYKLLEPSYYADPSRVDGMPPRDAALFVIRSMIGYAAEPLPWRIESSALLAYVPELIVWYIILALVPIGLLVGLRSEPLLTSLLAAHAGVSILIVALTGGNTGTLVRHRGLAMPFLVWLAALGMFRLVRWLAHAWAPVERRETV